MSNYWVALTIVHLAFTGFMAGLIWMIQVVHYPLFSLVGPANYQTYQREHMRRISRLLAVPWVGEVVLSALVFLQAPAPQLRVVAFVAGLAQVVIAVSTGFLAAPAHGRLVDGFDAGELSSLLRINWLRTALWTTRLALAALLVFMTFTLRHGTV